MKLEIPGYEVVRELGEGGMCVVYLARHKAFGETVAIKVLHDIFSRREEMRKRFLNEARILHDLDHENIVKVRDFIEFGGRVALVMDYIEGKTLDHVIGRETGPIPHEKALPLFQQLLDAVGHAHSKGVVHRDLKPSNVIVSDDGKAVVTDFGIAKVIGTAGMTRTGTKLGTLYYMSPEQVRGAKDIDHRTDIYSLGMTLYEMLAGRLPFDVDDETSEFDITQKIVFEDHEPPDRHYPHIPESLVKAVSCATAKAPDDRFKSCASFSTALCGPRAKEGNHEADVEVIVKKAAIDAADKSAGHGRFTSIEGLITDRLSLLEWRVGPDTSINWHEARDWIIDLGLEWRMPNRMQLLDLYDAGIRYGDWGPFENRGYFVWSEDISRDRLQAWYFHFGYGRGDWGDSRGWNVGGRAFAVRKRVEG